MFQAVIWTVLICGGAALVYWAVPRLGTPEPLSRVVLVIAVVVAIVLVVMVWLRVFGMASMPPMTGLLLHLSMPVLALGMLV